MTVRTKAQLDVLFADNITGDVGEGDLRDFVDSIVLSSVSSKSADYTVVEVDSIIEVTGGSAVTITLPDAAVLPSGKVFNIKRLGSATVTIDTGGGTIDGSVTQSLTAIYENLTVYSNGTNYGIL